MSNQCPPGRTRLPAPVRDLLVGGAIALLGGLTLIAELGISPAGLLFLDVAVLAVSVAAAPLLNRRLVPGAALLTVLALLSPVGTPGSTIATLHVAWRSDFRRAALIAGGGIAAHLLRWIWRPYPDLSFAWWLVLVVAVYAALLGWGSRARAREGLLRSLAERAQRAEADQERRLAQARAHERALIAREMHDVLAHRLSLVATSAGALEYRTDASAEQVAQAAGVIRTGAHQALEDLREVIGVLRLDPGDDTAGTGTKPQPTLAGIPALVTECTRAGMHVTVTDQTTGEPPSLIARTAYRIVQEGLTNARKHAPGEPVELVLTGAQTSGLLTLRLSNPLTGDGGTHLPGAGVGLVGLTERVRLVEGVLDAGARGNGHFELRARLPWGE